jgi:hypothetical protein
MGEIRFTASVLEAIHVMSQVQGGKVFARTKGVEWDIANPDTLITKVIRPVWCNFRFFHRIKSSPIRRTKRVDPTAKESGRWELERQVEFYYHGQLVARVELVGMKLDGANLETGMDNSSFWGVSKIGYYQYFDTAQDGGVRDWQEVELEAGLSGCFVRY